MPNVLWINGELAEIVRVDATRAKIVYLTCEPEDRLPTEVRYPPQHLGGCLGRKRVVLQGADILLIERVKPRFVEARNLRHLAHEAVAKLRFKRTHS